MGIRELQKACIDLESAIRKRFPSNSPEYLCVLKAIEELGEVSDLVVRVNQQREGKEIDGEKIKEELGKEISDVITSLLILANYFQIDLEDEFVKKLKVHFERWS